jgi:hypothetical protein
MSVIEVEAKSFADNRPFLDERGREESERFS